jgi:hypothetical protein
LALSEAERRVERAKDAKAVWVLECGVEWPSAVGRRAALSENDSAGRPADLHRAPPISQSQQQPSLAPSAASAVSPRIGSKLEDSRLGIPDPTGVHVEAGIERVLGRKGGES